MYQETVKGLFSEAPMYIRFRNDTDLPILIHAWVKGSNTLDHCRVGPKTNILLHSSVGEWHMDSMFDALTEDRQLWIDAGLEKHLIIGKFRSSPCARGDYSWMEYDEPFECVYSYDKNQKVPGLITLTHVVGTSKNI
jgi:hypothetical protein